LREKQPSGSDDAATSSITPRAGIQEMTRLRGSQLVGLALLAVIAYAPALRTGFLYDDHLLIESNPWIRTWSAKALHHDFSSGIFNTSEPIDFFRPLQTLS